MSKMVMRGLSINFPAVLDAKRDDLSGRIVDVIEDALVPHSETIAVAS